MQNDAPTAFAIDSPHSARVSAEVDALFAQWNDALRARDLDRLVARYTDDAVLLTPSASRPRIGRAAIRDYYASLLPMQPQATLVRRDLRMSDGHASETGLYALDLRIAGRPEILVTRYSFAYVALRGAWLISMHHGAELAANDCWALLANLS